MFLQKTNFLETYFDLIFEYEVIDEDSMTQEVQTERYRYLQAKHKQNENGENNRKGKILFDPVCVCVGLCVYL
jgi:hypothetical protein